MRVLFDHNVPKKLRRLLPGHVVSTSREYCRALVAVPLPPRRSGALKNRYKRLNRRGWALPELEQIDTSPRHLHPSKWQLEETAVS